MTYNVQGQLAPTNPEAVNEDAHNIIRKAAIRNGLTQAVTVSPEAVIDIDSSKGWVNQESSPFMTVLDSFLHSVKAAKLGLEGEITVTMTAKHSS